MYKVNYEDYLSIANENNEEILHIEYDADMESIIETVYDLVNYLNKKECDKR